MIKVQEVIFKGSYPKAIPLVLAMLEFSHFDCLFFSIFIVKYLVIGISIVFTFIKFVTSKF